MRTHLHRPLRQALRGRPARNAGPAFSDGRFAVEPLEARTLLSEYASFPIPGFFNLPDTLHSLSAPANAPPRLAAAAAPLGDIDGDGRSDFAIAALGQRDGWNTVTPGAVLLYSGATARIIRTLADGFADFGAALVPVDDWNADGVPDLFIGSPLAQDNGEAVGTVAVYSGADGTILWTRRGDQAFADFGRAVEFAGYYPSGDAGDFAPAVLVGAPLGGDLERGRAFVISGAPGLDPADAILHTLTGESPGEHFGSALHAINLAHPSAPGPYQPDFLIGAPDGGPGRAVLVSRVDASLIQLYSGWQAGDRFGASLQSLDSRGRVLLIGAPGVDAIVNGTIRPDAGIIYNFSTDGGAIENPLVGNEGEQLGSTMVRAGDIDGDGLPDVAVSAAAGVRIRFITNLDIFFRPLLTPPIDSLSLASAAAAAGDVDGDGRDDVLLLVPGESRAIVLSSLALVPPTRLSRSNPSGTFFIYDSRFDINVTFPGLPHYARYAIVDGAFRSFRALIPQMVDSDTILMGEGGTIVGATVVSGSSGGPAFGPRFLVSNGIRSTLADAITQIVGPGDVNINTLTPADIAPDGTILFNEAAEFGMSFRAWVFRAGVLSFLWRGEALDINAAGTILGRRDDQNGVGMFLLRAADGTETPINGLDSADRLNDFNQVAGTTNAYHQIALWDGGSIRVVSPPPGDAPTSVPSWRIIGFSNAGIIAADSRNVSEINNTSSYVTDWIAVYTPRDGFRTLSYTSGWQSHADPTPPLRALGVNADGDVIASRSGFRAVAGPPWILRPNAPISTTTNAVGSTFTASINADGDAILITTTGVTVSARLIGGLHDESGAELPVTHVWVYTDARDGHAYILALAGGRIFWGRGDDAAADRPLILAPLGSATLGLTHPSLFTSADGRVHLAGVDGAGNLVILYQSEAFPPDSPLNWVLDNLTLWHLRPQGQFSIPVAGGLTTFAAPWGANHIVYLDGAGAVHSVWWGRA